MPLYVVAYDVNYPHQGPVKEKLKKNGFGTLIPAAPGRYRKLPDTTLAVEAVSVEEAFAKFKRLALSAADGVVVERGIAVEASDYYVEGEVSTG